jgi:hypothetical protein
MPEIMDANIWDFSQFANTPPWLLHVCQMLTFNIARDNIWIVSLAGNGAQQLYSN